MRSATLVQARFQLRPIDALCHLTLFLQGHGKALSSVWSRIIAAVIKVAKGATNLFLEVEQNEHFVFLVLQKGYRQPIRKHDQKHLFPSRWRIYLSGIQDAPYIWNYEGTRTEGTEQTSSTLQNLVHRIWKSHVNANISQPKFMQASQRGGNKPISFWITL